MDLRKPSEHPSSGFLFSLLRMNETQVDPMDLCCYLRRVDSFDHRSSDPGRTYPTFPICTVFPNLRIGASK
jgi:hypothetical protein